MGLQDTAVAQARILTVPNALSLIRLLGVPLFLWLILGPHADGWAIVVLMVSGFTDWLDGYLARSWGQVSRLGQLLDPAVDRLYILAAIVGLTLRDIIPLWFALLLVARDVVLAFSLPVLQRYGYGPLPVHFLGKAATFCLLYAFPLLLLGDGTSPVADVSFVFGWAFAIWGTALYWWAGFLYLAQVRRLVVSVRKAKATMKATS
ncbi:MAG TPA: CDP-alcohol phosphatidyltransferase family protein [Actinomycetes bacterium]|nr:CDP-alcohol phosphatidyltransferase family protein [Actinomycetes bacterium]